MPRVLVFNRAHDDAATLAVMLAQLGFPGLPTTDPLEAVELVVEFPSIGVAVVECTPQTAPMCRVVRARRPQLAIVGIQPDGPVAPHRGCKSRCTLRPAG